VERLNKAKFTERNLFIQCTDGLKASSKINSVIAQQTDIT